MNADLISVLIELARLSLFTLKSILMRSRLLLLLLPLFIGCNPATEAGQEAKPSAEKPPLPILAPPDIFCYKNIFPYTDGSGRKDVEEMTLIIMNDIVTGVLATVPAQKKSRRGKLTGTRKDNLLDLSYVFIQEGALDTGRIQVIMSKEGAKVSSPDPDFWVPKKINKVDCEQ